MLQRMDSQAPQDMACSGRGFHIICPIRTPMFALSNWKAFSFGGFDEYVGIKFDDA